MGLLREELKKQNRAICGKYIINYLSDEQYLELKQMFINVSTMDSELGISGNITEDMIRYMFKNITNVGEEIDSISSEEMFELIKNGSYDFKRVIKEFKDIIIEIAEEIQDEQYNSINILNSYANVLNASTEMETVKKKMDKMLKKQGLDVTFEELLNATQNPQEFEKMLSEKPKVKKVKKKK